MKKLQVLLSLVLLSMACVPLLAKEKSDRTSKVPQYRFADTLEEQERQLAENPLLKRMNESRGKHENAQWRPTYHYVNPEGFLNDPNGLCFWQGRWHLFYQAYPPEDPRQHWGHAVSDDLVHWRDLPPAIYPNPENCCFSGATLVEKDRVIAMYHGTGVGNMVAISSDPLLLNWEKVTGKAVIPAVLEDGSRPPYTVFDPCIWKQGDYYYSLSGATQTDVAGNKIRAHFLFRSKDLAKWEYLHPFVENDRFSLVNDDGACPYFWPIGTGKDKKHILLHFSHTSGGKYLLGDYDTKRQKFVVSHGGNFNHGAMAPGGVHAPSATPDGKGGVIAIFNMNVGRGLETWNQIMTLPMRLTYHPEDRNNPIHIAPVDEIESLRRKHVSVEATTLPANEEVVLEHVRGNAMELYLELDKNAYGVELCVLRSKNAEEVTCVRFMRNRGYVSRRDLLLRRRGLQEYDPCVITLDATHSTLSPYVKVRPQETAYLDLPIGEPAKIRVFVDRNVVEVFVNDRQYVAQRVYPSREDSVGVSLRSVGRPARVLKLDAWQMENIWE